MNCPSSPLVADFTGKNVGELTVSAMATEDAGGRKGQESIIERNQKLGLKVGDELAPSDSLNQTIQFINSKDHARGRHEM